ncbi:MAG: tetratricopeptide repeat protein [Planctomycetes bacterium]|nr:tetratricopeptide repeat protein [Planctomycetota bacterium]
MNSRASEAQSRGSMKSLAANGMPTPADNFSCRQRELAALLTLLRLTHTPGDVTPDETEILAATQAPEKGAAGSTGWRPIVLVQGRSGMGKSRLLEKIATTAAGAGVSVKELFCYERQSVPFLPVLRAVKEVIAESTSREPLWRKYARVLARVFPDLASELGEALSVSELSGDDGKLQLFDALAGILMESSRDRPLLLLIHDLHRSDPGTVEFLRYLGRNVYLEESIRRREARAPGDPASENAEENWKEIGSRDGRSSRQFITDGLADDESASELMMPGSRLLVIANYLLMEPIGAGAGEAATEGDEQDRRMVRSIEKLTLEPFAFSMSLAPLADQELSSLIANSISKVVVDADVVKRLAEMTGGNPLRALEICRCLAERDDFGVDRGKAAAKGAPQLTVLDVDRLLRSYFDSVAVAPAPAAPDAAAAPADAGAGGDGDKDGAGGPSGDELLIGFLVNLRLRSLDGIQVRVLEVLSILRRPAQVGLLVEILELPREGIVTAIEGLRDRAFVNVLALDREPRYYLTHEDYIKSIYASIEPERRRQIHQRIGIVLGAQERAREPVRAFEIYEHLRASSAPRDSVQAGVTAARYFAAAYSLDLAAEICHDLLGLLSAAEDRDVRLELLGELSAYELRRGRPLVAKAHIKRLLEEGEKVLSPAARLEALLRLSETYQATGEPYKGIKVLNRALKTCSSAIDARRKAQLAARLAELRLARKDPKRAINICSQALKETEEQSELEAERIKLLEVLAAAHLARGESLAALQHYQTLLEVVERARNEAKLASVLTILGRVYYDRGNFFRAARYLFRALDAIRRQQDLRGLSRAYDSLGKVYRNSGDLLRGLEYFNRCLRLRERIGDVEGLSPTLNSLGSLYAHTGDYHRAIRYFKRSVENSERLGDTVGIVRSFLHLGRAYYEVGELRKVESLVKQILILAQEFGLPELEGEGYRLNGSLLCLRRDFKRGERDLLKSIEIAKRHSKKNGEASALLDLGELLTEKEDFEAALKQISRGQLLAEEIQSVPLQARAHLLKGNVYRFLKGGNLERAKESFRKGMDLVSGENHLPITWELDYSIAKLFQAAHEYSEAGEAYRRAERILDRMAANLPEDMKVVYRDDGRRKTFYEDYRRFQKDASDRRKETQAEKPATAAAREETGGRAPAPVAGVEAAVDAATPDAARGDRVIEALVQLSKAGSLAEFAPLLLKEARRLVPAPCGFLLQRVGESQIRLLATSDMGAEEEWSGPDRVPGSAARQVAESGEPLRSGGDAWQQLLRSVGAEQSYRNRSALVMPLASVASMEGALYLERPTARNPFTEEEQQWIARLVAAAGGQFNALLSLDGVRYFRGTRLLKLGGLDEELPALVRKHARGEQAFFVVEVAAPGIDRRLAEEDRKGSAGRLAAQILNMGGTGILLASCVGNDTLAYAFDGVRREDSEGLVATLRTGIAELLGSAQAASKEAPEIAVRVIEPERAGNTEDDLLQSLRSQILKRQGEFNLDRELTSLSKGGLTLKEAKLALERRYIAAELSKSNGNITRAADSLGVHRPQLSHLIKKHKVRRDDFE